MIELSINVLLRSALKQIVVEVCLCTIDNLYVNVEIWLPVLVEYPIDKSVLC